MSATWDSKALKATPIADDEILIIDTADSRNQKRATLTSLGATVWTRNTGSGFLFPTTLTDLVGIGTNTPLATLNVLSTTEQLRLSNNVSTFATFTVASGVGFSLVDASFDGISFSVVSQDGTIRDVHFKPDGTKMYIVGDASNALYQYTLPTAFSLVGATFDSVTLSVATQDTTPTGMTFNTAGTKLYVVGAATSTIYQYSLPTPFVLTGGTVDAATLVVTTQDTFPTGMHFNTTGSKLFITGDSSDTVYEYDLSTVFDLSTATFNSVSLSVAAEDTTPRDVHFNTTGSKMFIIGATNGAIYQYNLPTPFSLVGATYDNISFSIVLQDSLSTGLAFSTDGSKMYMSGASNDRVFEYSSFESGLAIGPSSIDLNIAGGLSVDTDTLVVDAANDIVGIGVSAPLATLDVLSITEQLRLSFDVTNFTSFTMGISFDLVNASFDSVSFAVGTEDASPESIAFNNDGTKLFMLGNFNNTVFQYSLPTPFILTGASFDSVSFSVASEDSTTESIIFNADGSKMFMLGGVNDTVFQYSLPTPFILTGASFDSVSFSVATQDTDPAAIEFNNDGTKLFMIGNFSNTVFQYSLPTPFILTGASFDSVSFSVGSEDTSPKSIIFNADGSKMFMLGDFTETVFQYTTGTSPGLTIAPSNANTFITGDLSVSGSTSNVDGSLDATAQNVVPIYNISDFPTPVTGVITLAVNTLYEIRAPISTSNRFVLQNNTVFRGINSDQNSLTYTGTGTFFTATGITEDVQFLDMEVIATGTGATLFSLQGTSNPTITFSGFTGFDNLGALTDFGAILWREVVLDSFDTGITFANIQSVLLHTFTTITNPGVSSEGGMVIFTGRATTFISVDAFGAVSISPVDIFDISPTVNALASLRINNVRNLGTGDFFTTGSTGTITAFANADPSSVAVTSVTDNAGVAVFTTTAVHGLIVEDVVVHTTFSEGTYNGTFVVSAVTSTTEYEVTLNGINVAFVATGTGTLQNKRVLVTSTAHGLSADTPVLITNTINYDAGYNIKDILTNSYEIQAVFVVTETGNWSTGSLIETEVRMDVSHSSPQKSSNSIGCVVLNGNTTSTTVSTQNVFIDIIGNDAIVPASNIERWKLIDTDNGTIEYIGNTPYAGQYTGTFSVLSPGSQHYELRIVKQPAAGGGFSPLIDAIIVPFSTDSAAGTFPINVALTAVKGDQFKPEFQNIDGTDDMTFTNLSMGPVI